MGIKKVFEHKSFIPVMVISYIIVLFLTMFKDYRLTGDNPNPVFYFTLMPLIVIVSSLVVFGVSKIMRRPISFANVFKVMLFSQLIMQLYENISKIIYYVLLQWSLLWFLSFPLYIWLAAILFHRIGDMRKGSAFVLSLVSFVVMIGFVYGFTALTGISTPGS